MEKFQLGNTGYDPTIRTENDRIPARFGHLNKIVNEINAISNRFDVTFPASEFKNIGTTPLVLIESNRTIIITSANAILTEQTEAFEFIDAFAIILTNAVYPQLVESGKPSNSPHFNILNSSFVFNQGDRYSILGQGNATISTDGVDSLTGDGFVRIIGTYYEIDL